MAKRFVITGNKVFDVNSLKSYSLTRKEVIKLLKAFPDDKGLNELHEKFESKYRLFKSLANTTLMPSYNQQELYYHQRQGVFLLASYPFNIGIFDEPGAGKTLQILKAYELLQQGYILIVVCPKNAISVWERQIKKFVPTLTYTINTTADYTNILIYNYEQVVKFMTTIYNRALNEKVILCLDEVHRVKNTNTKAYKDISVLKNVVDRIWVTDGTPIADRPEDAVGLLNIMTDDKITMAEFRDEYINPITGGYIHLDRLKEEIDRFSIRRLKSECLDLPSKIYIDIDIEMDKKLRDIYDKLKKENSNPLSLVNRLNMLVNMPDNHIGYNPKIDAAMDLLEDYPGKIVFWSYYIDMLKIMQEKLNKCRIGNALIYGGQNNKVNEEEKYAFQNDDTCRVLLASISYAKESIDLSNCSTFIYMSRDFKKVNWIQSIERGDRIGQSKHPNIIVLKIKGTTDDLIDDILKDKIKWSAKITGDELKVLLNKY